MAEKSVILLGRQKSCRELAGKKFQWLKSLLYCWDRPCPPISCPALTVSVAEKSVILLGREPYLQYETFKLVSVAEKSVMLLGPPQSCIFSGQLMSFSG